MQNQSQQQQQQSQQQSLHTLMQYLQQQQYMQQNHPSLPTSTTITDRDPSADTIPKQYLSYSKTSNVINTTHNPSSVINSNNIIATNMGSSITLPPQKIQYNSSIINDSFQSVNYHPSQQTVKSSPYTIVKVGQGNKDYNYGSDINTYGPTSSYTNYAPSNSIQSQHSPAYDVSNTNDHSGGSIISIPNTHQNDGRGGGGGAYFNTTSDIIQHHTASPYDTTQINPINMSAYDLSSSGHFNNTSIQNGHHFGTGVVHHNSNGHDINAYVNSNGAYNNPQQQQQHQYHEDPLTTVNGIAAASSKHTSTTRIVLPKINTNTNTNVKISTLSGSNYSIDRGDGGSHLYSTNASTTTHSGTSNRSSVVVTKASLSNSKDDIGRSLQLFSFRSNAWERIDLIDYEPSKHLHKCLHVDGTIQWLDLSKKPVRET